MDADIIFQLKEITKTKMCRTVKPASKDMALDMHLIGEHDIEINTHEYAANEAGYHYHSFFEMNYVFYGSCVQNLENHELVELSPGDFCIMNPDAWHSCTISSPNDIVINFMMSPKLFNSTFFSFISDRSTIGHFLLSYLRSEKSGDNNYLLFRHAYSPYVDTLISQILREYLLDRVYTQTNIRCLLILLFSEILYNSAQREADEGSLISEILAYISNNLDKASLKSTADHFYMNANYLSSYIKQQTGRNFSNILNNLKLAEAKNLLQTTDLSMADISERLGYKDSLSFHHMFKNKTGMTPTKFRTEIRP